MTNLQQKRIYEPYAPTDGFRILVDRLWPRGVKKETARIDLWAKDITPTTALREDYHSGRDTWPAFEAKYRAELLHNPALDSFLQTVSQHETVTLLFAGKDTDHTHVTVLLDVIRQQTPSET